MKHRDQTTPLLPPEAYIAIWKAAAQKPKPQSLLRRIVGRLATAKLFMLLAACSVKHEALEPEAGPVDTMSLVWAQPPRESKPVKALPSPRMEDDKLTITF